MYLSTVRGRTYGFVPNNEPAQRIKRYRVSASVAAIYPGDLVELQADGTIRVVVVTNPTALVGVAAAYNAANTANVSFPVYGGPGAEFHVSDDEASNSQVLAATSLGARCQVKVTTGDTSILRSKQVILATSAFTTAASPLTLLRLHEIEADTFSAASGTTANSRTWVVLINNDLLAGYQQLGV